MLNYGWRLGLLASAAVVVVATTPPARAFSALGAWRINADGVLELRTTPLQISQLLLMRVVLTGVQGFGLICPAARRAPATLQGLGRSAKCESAALNQESPGW